MIKMMKKILINLIYKRNIQKKKKNKKNKINQAFKRKNKISIKEKVNLN
jgi:hypothetical protein